MSHYTKQIDTTPTNYTATTGDELVDHLAGIDTAIGSLTTGLVAGQLMLSASDTIPLNTLYADGSAVSRTTYATLYAAIGVMYGNGDGSTTFNLPDYQGWFLRGFGGGTDPDSGSRTDRGDGTTGNNVGTVQTFTRNSHRHAYNRDTNNRTGGGGGVVTNSGSNNNTSATGGNEERPANVYIKYCIVYEA